MGKITYGGLDITTFCNYNIIMKIEWDEAKRRSNLQKHGIDFADVAPLFDNDHIIIEDDRFEYGEVRLIALGLLIGRLIVVVYVERGTDTIRLISARKASNYEEKQYFSQIAH